MAGITNTIHANFVHHTTRNLCSFFGRSIQTITVDYCFYLNIMFAASANSRDFNFAKYQLSDHEYTCTVCRDRARKYLFEQY